MGSWPTPPARLRDNASNHPTPTGWRSDKLVKQPTAAAKRPAGSSRRSKRPAPAASRPDRGAGSVETPADRALRRAIRYQAAFPGSDIEAIASHLAVVNTGSAMGRAVTRHLAAFDLNPARYSLLRALYFSPEKRLPQNEVAREMGTSPPNVTQLLDALERDGYVARAVSETDRRVTYARLTPAGEAKCAQLVPDMVTFIEDSMSGFSAREMVQLRTLLARLRKNLERYLPGED